MPSYKKKRHVRDGSVQHFKIGGARKSKKKSFSKKKGGSMNFRRFLEMLRRNRQTGGPPPLGPGQEPIVVTDRDGTVLVMQQGHPGSSVGFPSVPRVGLPSVPPRYSSCGERTTPPPRYPLPGPVLPSDLQELESTVSNATVSTRTRKGSTKGKGSAKGKGKSKSSDKGKKPVSRKGKKGKKGRRG